MNRRQRIIFTAALMYPDVFEDIDEAVEAATHIVDEMDARTAQQ